MERKKEKNVFLYSGGSDAAHPLVHFRAFTKGC